MSLWMADGYWQLRLSSHSGTLGFGLFDFKDGNRTNVILFCDAFHKRHYFIARGRVEPTCRLIKKQYFRASNQLAGDAHTAFLTTTDTFLDRGPNESSRLVLYSKCIEKSGDPLLSVFLRNCALLGIKLIFTRTTYIIIRNGEGQYFIRDMCAHLGRANFAAKRRVSSTVKDPMSTSSCSTYELIRLNLSSDTSLPLIKISPLTSASAAWSLCARTLSRVVLPLPEGPIKAITSPDTS